MTSLFTAPISTDAPLPLFPRRDNHPVSRAVVVGDPDKPVETNKFYSNLYLGSQTCGVWTLPYLLWHTKDPSFWGLSISQTEASQLATGPDPNANPYQYYISPLGLRSFTFSAQEFTASASGLALDTPTASSVNLILHANKSNPAANQKITFPLVQGMGFVTARYENIRPIISSGILFREVTAVASPRADIQKWVVILEDGRHWIIYACPAPGKPWLNLSLIANTRLVAAGQFTGFIQIAKVAGEGAVGALEATLDSAAGAWVQTTVMEATVSGKTAWIKYRHHRQGANNAGGLLMYALPHHVTSFSAATAGRRNALRLRAPTKGMMVGIVADEWVCEERELPEIGWIRGGGLPAGEVATRVRDAARRELKQDMDAQSNLDSMYFSGKALGKFAQIVLGLTLTNLDAPLARSSLNRLKSSFERFASNKQKFPLVYDRTWRGLVSDAAFVTGDPGVDFGNSFYNDHHFHYAYFIYAAAVIGRCDQLLNNSTSWLTSHRAWVNSLVRDIANPHASDRYFPVTRAFDWFNGHSWAKGLFESADGKDQESSSEDTNFAYALKLWGAITSQPVIEQTGNVMMAVMKRSMNEYFLMTANNKNHPPGFIGNKVTGILFENKCDHVTYFGANIEYIQGIHMIPLTPVSPYIRSIQFCREEWDKWFSGNRINSVQGGWRGILHANQAIFDPGASWAFFTQEGFNDGWLDGGASLTWYLVFVAGMGGATAAGKGYLYDQAHEHGHGRC